MKGMKKTNSTAQGRQAVDQPRQRYFERASGNEIDDARDDGLKMVPQPSFQQE